MLGRATEALGYTEIAEAVFSGELGKQSLIQAPTMRGP